MQQPWARPGKQGPMGSMAARNEAEETSLEQSRVGAVDTDLSDRVAVPSRA